MLDAALTGGRLTRSGFILAVALSAFLLFWLQPLIAKSILPTFGGTPSVWTTCVMFFQGGLLLGYLYVHLLTRMRFSKQVITHGLIILGALAMLPMLSAEWEAPSQSSAGTQLLGQLAQQLGFPLIVVSASAPLLQMWFARSAQEPYFLYAASNCGSFAALAAYPLMLERVLASPDQILLWRSAFVIYIVLLMLCAYSMRRRPSVSNDEQEPVEAVIKFPQRFEWILWAAIPSSLMLGVTTSITIDIAAVPLMWVVPLALFIATYILAFSRFGQSASRLAHGILPVALGCAVLVWLRKDSSVLQVPIQLTIFACLSMLLHTRLFKRRPDPSHLTDYYLCIAAGGFAGGVFNSLIAPALFTSVIEYHLVLIVALSFVYAPYARALYAIATKGRWAGWSAGGIALAAVIAGSTAYIAIESVPFAKQLLFGGLLFVSLTAQIYAFGPRATMLMTALFLFLATAIVHVATQETRGIDRSRTFFGSYAVLEETAASVPNRSLRHGSTIHGNQALNTDRALEPTTYYDGLALLFEGDRSDARTVGVIGLGVGTLACAWGEGDRITFFEIDPEVERIARTHFSYLRDCDPDTVVVIGDGRIEVAKVPLSSFDYLIIDAFSSDSIPVHLLTTEAIDTYRRALKHNGFIAFHISNRYLNLAPVLAAIAASKGWHVEELRIAADADHPLSFDSRYVLLYPNERDVDRQLATHPRLTFSPIERSSRVRPWTDKYSNIVPVIELKSSGK